MSASRGKARRAQKQKKRREVRQKARATRNDERGPARADEAIRKGPGALHLSAEQLQAIGYDAATGPDGPAWLLLDEQSRLVRITRYHQEALAADAQPPNPTRHAAMHLVVENQLAADDPAEMRPAFARLRADGMTRHDALHAAGWLLMHYLKLAANNPANIDHDAYRKDLETFSLPRWLLMMQQAQ